MKFDASFLEKKDMKYSTWSLVKDMVVFVRPYKGRFIIASLSRLSGDLANLYPAFALATIVNLLTSSTVGVASLRQLWVLLGLWTLAQVWRIVSQNFAKYTNYILADRVSLDAQLLTMRHLFNIDMSWHERENAGNKLKRLQNGGDGLGRILRIWINNLIEIGVNLLGIVVILFFFDRLVTLWLVLFMVVYFFVALVLNKRAAVASIQVNAQDEHVTGLMFETINNMRSVKVMSMRSQLYQLLTTAVTDLYAKIKVRVFTIQSRYAILNVSAQIFRFFAMAFIVWGVWQKHFEVGFIILFNQYYGRLWESVDELSSVSQDLAIARVSIARMQAILHEPITIDDETGKVPFPPGWQDITVRNLSFAYDSNKVLNDLSFTIKRGEKIGVVGLSGAGKSTLFKLLAKEHEVFSGDILIDGTPIQQLSKTDYFNHVAVVLQDTEVFNFSLRDNIAICRTSPIVNEADLQQALEIAHVTDFLPKLPQSVDTVIGEKGVKLSGGEKQRLGLARAIYKQPEILLLDEATSHLDLESEEKIQDSLHRFFKNVTAVVIAHRLTTIKEMDKILVLEDGKLIEQGSFEALMERRGRFFELWQKQKL